MKLQVLGANGAQRCAMHPRGIPIPMDILMALLVDTSRLCIRRASPFQAEKPCGRGLASCPINGEGPARFPGIRRHYTASAQRGARAPLPLSASTPCARAGARRSASVVSCPSEVPCKHAARCARILNGRRWTALSLSNETRRTSERARVERAAASDCRRKTYLKNPNAARTS